MLLSLASTSAYAVDEPFTLVRVDVTVEDLRIYWRDESGRPIRRFDRLSSLLATQRKRLMFGMNAGMYHADSAPVGLLILAGKRVAPLNLSEGTGNFFIKPNGVFLMSKGRVQVVDATDYEKFADGVLYATQSGPMLLKQGKINPAFGVSSTSRLIRNGVCAQGSTALFVISEKPVNFYEFATYFRDELRCSDALYLDGVVSSLHSQRQGRSDFRAELGPIFGIAE
jgi:uncharacterized protein YigE (DUF2233 family)